MNPFYIVIIAILVVQTFKVLGQRAAKKAKQAQDVVAKKCPKCGNLRGTPYQYYTGDQRPAGELVCGHCGFQGKASEFS